MKPVSLFVVKLGADTLVQTVEAIQPGGGLWKQVFLNVWLREMQKVWPRGAVKKKYFDFPPLCRADAKCIFWLFFLHFFASE